MIDIIRPADREAWLKARRSDVTASVAGALLGAHPYASAYSIWAEKTGRIEQADETSAMKRGTHLRAHRRRTPAACSPGMGHRVPAAQRLLPGYHGASRRYARRILRRAR